MKYKAEVKYPDGDLVTTTAEKNGGSWLIGGDYQAAYPKGSKFFIYKDGNIYWLKGSHLIFQDNYEEQAESVKLAKQVKTKCFEAMSDDEWERIKQKSAGRDLTKKKLSPEAKKLVDRYKVLNKEQDRYTSSIFYKGEGDPREQAMLKEQQEIAAKMKSLGYELDLYW